MELPIVERITSTHQPIRAMRRRKSLRQLNTGRDKMFYVLKGGTGVRASGLFNLLEIEHTVQVRANDPESR